MSQTPHSHLIVKCDCIQIKAHLCSLYVRKQICTFSVIIPSLPLYFHVYLMLGWMLCNTSGRRRPSSHKQVAQTSTSSLPSSWHSFPVWSPSSCSVGVVCPCAGGVNHKCVYNSVPTSVFYSRSSKSSAFLSKYSSSLCFAGLAWTVGYATDTNRC